jgi:hypothetical protein
VFPLECLVLAPLGLGADQSGFLCQKADAT